MGPVDQLTEIECKTLKQLPLYQKTFSNDFISLHTTSSSLSSSLKCLINYDALNSSLFPPEFLMHSNVYIFELLKKLNVKVISRAIYFKDYFLPNLQNLIKACIAVNIYTYNKYILCTMLSFFVLQGK